MYNSKKYKAMADKSAEKERLFNEWFTKSYDRLRGTLRRYGMLDEDNFHDTYLFVRRQVLVPGKDIFLRCGEEAKFLSEDDLNGCERLVRDILRFVRQKFSYEEYRMFMLRFYEAQFSFKALAECMGISASAISQKVCRIVDAVRTHSGFAWRSRMLAVESFMY